jgi:hypothetical protein
MINKVDVMSMKRKYLESIKKYIKNHPGIAISAATAAVGAVGLYLTNASDMFFYVEDYLGKAYSMGSIGVIMPAKTPQPLRVLFAYLSATLELLSVPIGLMYRRKDR